MTQSDLRALLESRRAQWADRLDVLLATQRDTAVAISVAEAHLNEISFALEQLPVGEAPPTEAPAAPTSSQPEKSPREKCAALILEDYEGKPLPENIDGLTPIYAETWPNPRTLRAGLELAKQRRAKEPRTEAVQPPPSPAENNPPAESLGAGADDDPPAVLDFLDRRGQKNSAAAE